MFMSTMLSAGDLRVLIEAREGLEKNSEICLNELCTLDMSRLYLENKLTVLTQNELLEVERKLKVHLGML